jgi:hypothetical protein
MNDFQSASFLRSYARRRAIDNGVEKNCQYECLEVNVDPVLRCCIAFKFNLAVEGKYGTHYSRFQCPTWRVAMRISVAFSDHN